MSSFPHVFVELLVPNNSDHSPFLIHCWKLPSKKHNSFHFQEAWMSHPDYNPLVHQTWCNTIGDVVRKLEGIKESSIIFNKNVFGNIFNKKERKRDSWRQGLGGLINNLTL